MTEKTEFLQAIDDAILDADSLERFINGDETQDVLTRLSAQYPTIKKAIKQLFENGGIPATPFETVAEMSKSDAQEGDYAIVLNDPNSNLNGIYTKTASGWAKSSYDPAKSAISYISRELDKAHINPEYDKLYVFADSIGNVVGYVDKEAKLHLVGLKSSVQDEIKKLQVGTDAIIGGLVYTDVEEVTHVFADSQDNVVAYLDGNAGLNLLGLKSTVQDEVNNLQFAINDLLHTVGMNKSPEPIGMKKGNYVCPTSQILSSEAKASENLVRYAIPNAEYGDNHKVIHPTVIELPIPMRGYKYLMSITPYEDANYDAAQKENPFVYGSNDLKEWKELTGFVQPLDLPTNQKDPSSPHRDYLSDPFWFYDYSDNSLCLGYREFRQSWAGATLFYRKTKNGLVWDEPQVLKEFSRTIHFPSPSIVYDVKNSRYVMHSFETNRNTICVQYNDSLDPNGWSDYVMLTGLNKQAVDAGLLLNHLETKFIGDTLFMCIGDANNSRGFYWAYATDENYQNFTLSTKPIIDSSWTQPVYKGSFIPVVKDKQLTIHTFFTPAPDYLYSATYPVINL